MWILAMLLANACARILDVVLMGVTKMPPHRQLNSSTLRGSGWLRIICVLSWPGIALVAVGRHYGMEVLSISIWDRGKKPQREERLFGTKFHHWEASIIYNGRQFVSFKTWVRGNRALWSFYRAKSLKITPFVLLLPVAVSVADAGIPP